MGTFWGTHSSCRIYCNKAAILMRLTQGTTGKLVKLTYRRESDSAVVRSPGGCSCDVDISRRRTWTEPDPCIRAPALALTNATQFQCVYFVLYGGYNTIRLQFDGRSTGIRLLIRSH